MSDLNRSGNKIVPATLTASPARTLNTSRKKDEDEYPRKARLFWVRHEHFFWRKTVKIADFTTASLPRKCYECPWGEPIPISEFRLKVQRFTRIRLKFD